MPWTFRAVVALPFLALTAVGAEALDVAKIDAITKASESFVALAKDSADTGQAPRQSDPRVKEFLDTIFDTREIQSGPVLPMSALDRLNAWNLAVLKVGFVYILAGTGVTDVANLQITPETVVKLNRNTAEFAPEIGRYLDAQLWIEAAIIDTVTAFLANASAAEIDRPNIKSGLAKIRAGATQMINGLLTTLPLEGLSDAWRRDRLSALAAIGPKAAKFVLPEQARSLLETATAVAGQINDATVKAALTSFAATLARR
jgi:hypothetical protein